MSEGIMTVLCLLASGFWIYIFVSVRDEEKHPKAKHSFRSEPGFIQVKGRSSRQVIVLRQPAAPNHRAKTA
jgi:hypothetical protein